MTMGGATALLGPTLLVQDVGLDSALHAKLTPLIYMARTLTVRTLTVRTHMARNHTPAVLTHMVLTHMVLTHMTPEILTPYPVPTPNPSSLTAFARQTHHCARGRMYTRDITAIHRAPTCAVTIATAASAATLMGATFRRLCLGGICHQTHHLRSPLVFSATRIAGAGAHGVMKLPPPLSAVAVNRFHPMDQAKSAMSTMTADLREATRSFAPWRSTTLGSDADDANLACRKAVVQKARSTETVLPSVSGHLSRSMSSTLAAIQAAVNPWDIRSILIGSARTHAFDADLLMSSAASALRT